MYGTTIVLEMFYASIFIVTIQQVDDSELFWFESNFRKKWSIKKKNVRIE